ncbi:hypothetical protein ACOME3_003071 [Neoechinorhynchus agilis]
MSFPPFGLQFVCKDFGSNGNQLKIINHRKLLIAQGILATSIAIQMATMLYVYVYGFLILNKASDHDWIVIPMMPLFGIQLIELSAIVWLERKRNPQKEERGAQMDTVSIVSPLEDLIND